MARCFNANCPSGMPSQRLSGWCAWCKKALGTDAMRDKEAKAA